MEGEAFHEGVREGHHLVVGEEEGASHCVLLNQVSGEEKVGVQQEQNARVEAVIQLRSSSDSL